MESFFEGLVRRGDARRKRRAEVGVEVEERPGQMLGEGSKRRFQVAEKGDD